MARIAGIDLPRDKRIEISLTYIYGIGLTTSQKLLAEAGINPDTRTRDLTEDEVVKLRELIDKDVIVAHLFHELPKPGVELGKRLRITFDIAAVTVEHVKVDKIGEAETFEIAVECFHRLFHAFGVAVSPISGASKYVNISLYLLYIDLCASSHITRSK